jgi:hypothetical protein
VTTASFLPQCQRQSHEGDKKCGSCALKVEPEGIREDYIRQTEVIEVIKKMVDHHHDYGDPA